MCPPPCGPRRARMSRPRKVKTYPESWLNEKRMVVGNAVLSTDGKTLVKIRPALTGEYVVPASVTRILVDACRNTKFSRIVFHAGIRTEIGTWLFNGNYDLSEIVLPSGKTAEYDARRHGIFLEE